MLNTPLLTALARILPASDIARLKASAEEVQKLEDLWSRKLKSEMDRVTSRVLKSLEERGVPGEVDFAEFFAEHYFAVARKGFELAESEKEFRTRPKPRRFALFARSEVPRSLEDLKKLYDLFRRKKKIPEAQRKLADSVKKEYLKRVHDVWKRHSKDFRDGEEFSQAEVIRKVRRAADVSYSRAKMTVNTETTKYYNQARREVYDTSPDVTHYLFVAVRDHATTKWCKTRQGIVYSKGDRWIDKETPPIHWNCRSELLPLTPLNPAHLKLINNPAFQRKNRSPAALPKEFRKSVA